MKRLQHPLWILLLISLPQLLVISLFISTFNIIGTLLYEENILAWKLYGSFLCVLMLASTIYAVVCLVMQKKVSLFFAIPAMIGYITFLYAYLLHSDKVIPWSIPNWMLLKGDVEMLLYALVLPAVLYCLLLIVIRFVENGRSQNPGISFLIAAAIPFFGYLLFVLPAVHGNSIFGGEHTFFVLVISATVLFMFFLLRGMITLAQNRQEKLQKFSIIWKILIAVIFPAAGLLLNEGKYFDIPDHIFGNFDSLWFYILAVLNGILICLPSPDDRRIQLALFFLRSITFSFTLYFFLVFIPYLPLAFLAIIVVGLGFLMLTPVLLMVIHVQLLSDNWQSLRTYFSKQSLVVVFLAGVIVIPAVITVNFISERRNLFSLLNYVYKPDYSAVKDIHINVRGGLDAVAHLEEFKYRDGNLFSANAGVPFISAYYQWLVLDNQTISNKKMNDIARIFSGEGENEVYSDNQDTTETNTFTHNVVKATTYDKQEKIFRSKIILEVQNTAQAQREFTTAFDVPAGAWISDYYLWMDSGKKRGIMAEKKSALWVYNEIMTYRKDPGILYFTSGNEVELRIFPVPGFKTRKTEIDLIHREPVSFNFAGEQLYLDDSSAHITPEIFSGQHCTYIPAQVKRQLPLIHRDEQYDFIIDCSKNSVGVVNEYLDRTNAFIKAHNDSFRSFTVTSANYKTKRIQQSQQKAKLPEAEEGFFLERSLKEIFVTNFLAGDAHAHIPIVVSDHLESAIFLNDLSNLQFTFPDSEFFYVLTDKRQLEAHSMTDHPLMPISNSGEVTPQADSVRVYTDEKNNKTYLQNDDQCSIVVSKDQWNIGDLEKEHDAFEKGILMSAAWQQVNLHPELSDEYRLPLIKSSFVSGFLSPLTSYIVVESEAQEHALLEKQRQLLNANSVFDAGEAEVMAEPPLYLLLLIGMLIISAYKICNLKKDSILRS